MPPGPSARSDILPLGTFQSAKLELYGVLLGRLRAAGIRAVLVVLPSHHPPLAVPEEDEASERWKTLAAAHGADFIPLTAASHPEFSDRALFADAFHLNHLGAAAASRLLSPHLGAR